MHMLNVKIIAFLIILFGASYSVPNAYAYSGDLAKCIPGQLRSAIAHIERNYGKVTIVSSYSKRNIAGTRILSKHALCRAVDFKVSRNRAKTISWLNKQRLEVITYSCGMHHIHIATGSYKANHCVNSYGIRIRKGKKRK